MAKRKRFGGFKRRTRSFSPFKRRSKSRSKGSSAVKAIQFDAMIYGGIRAHTSNLLQPIIGKIPLGGIADEVAMGVLNYFVAKNTSGMIKNIAMKGLVIENARIGEAVVSGGLGGFLSSNKSVANDSAYNY